MRFFFKWAYYMVLKIRQKIILLLEIIYNMIRKCILFVRCIFFYYFLQDNGAGTIVYILFASPNYCKYTLAFV